MQKSIKSFFKQSPASKSAPQTSNSDDLFDGIRVLKSPEIRIKYTRQALYSHQSTRLEATKCASIGEEKLEVVQRKGKTLNKKRNYAQFHLELGQSDFLLHTCKVCGIKYAKGYETDEKLHITFHKNFTHVIPFKGWRHERVIDMPLLEDRVILVSPSDPPAQRNKVYLYISSQRIAGCVVVEPINTAHKVLLDSMDKGSDSVISKEAISKQTTLFFGEICFQRDVFKKASSPRSSKILDSNALGSFVCEEEGTSASCAASCGIRAIWVTPSNRRKHIATHLLDAVRFCACYDCAKVRVQKCRTNHDYHAVTIEKKSFSIDRVPERSQLAFSQPTTTGMALALKYNGTGSFLLYKAS